MYTIIDIETTGNGLKGNKITEISIFKFDGEKIVDEFTSLVNPQCPIPYFITGLTGIDDETVRDAPTFTEIAPNVQRITKDCIFVAHAVNFDYGVIKEEFRQLGVNFLRKKLCTVRLSRKLIPGLQSYSLGKLCSAVGIPITDRHRARGDAKATVTLFKRLLQKPDANTVIKKFLNSRSQEATLPPHLDKKVIDAIPHRPGVYYFLDQKNTIIYVGKAKNLKKRVLGHFYDKSEHEIKLCREVAHVDFELSGSELIALLMESAAIKKYFPKFNRVQKHIVKRYAIFSYENRNGLLHLGFANKKQVAYPIAIFYSPTDCRTFLKKLCDDFDLCPKYCQLIPLRSKNVTCTKVECEGICEGLSSIKKYNRKVEKVISLVRESTSSYFLKEKGRHENEKGVVQVKDGEYMGFGFVENSANISSIADLEAYIIPKKNSPEIERILINYTSKLDNILQFDALFH